MADLLRPHQLPAIAIGGPPHSGKSVLTYSLTQLLRDQRIDHYVLRACPDGEGDWSQEATPATVQAIRCKGAFSPTFIANVCGALQQRHLPLLVDVGGRPTVADEAIFRACTHLIIVAATPAGLVEWRTFAERLKLPVIAELLSVQSGSDRIDESYPLLRGQVVGLERGHAVAGPILTQLAALVRALFALKPNALRQLHLDLAPTELAVDLERVGRQLELLDGRQWDPTAIAPVLAYLPAQTDLAIYGRCPNWLYAAIASWNWPARLYQFDARLGWVEPVTPTLAENAQPQPIGWTITHSIDHSWLQVQIPDTYLDYAALADLVLPRLPVAHGIVISGKLPLWLFTGLVRAYREAVWLAIFQPQVGPVVIHSQQPAFPIGARLTLQPWAC